MKTFNFCNHGLRICKEGVLFWLEKEIAIVSDLHLEKGSSYASSGQYIPPYDSEETLLKLLDCLLYTSPSPRDKRQSRMPSSA